MTFLIIIDIIAFFSASVQLHCSCMMDPATPLISSFPVKLTNCVPLSYHNHNRVNYRSKFIVDTFGHVTTDMKMLRVFVPVRLEQLHREEAH